MRLNIDTNAGPSSIRIGFTDQRLTAHGGMIVWSHFLQQQQFHHQLNSVLPHTPTSPNAFAPADIALGFLGGILAGADKLTRVAWLQSDPAVAEVLGIEAVPSQSTLSRFFGVFSQRSCQGLAGSHARAVFALPTRHGGETLDCRHTIGGFSANWIRGRCCMRTAIRRAWRWATRGGDSSRVIGR